MRVVILAMTGPKLCLRLNCVRWSDVEGLSGQGNDLLSGVASPFADARALLCDIVPARLGSDVGKPEGECTTLKGADRIDPASVVEKETVSVKIFFDAEALFIRVEIAFFEIGRIESDLFSDGVHLVRPNIDGARRSGAARPAALAFKRETLIEKVFLFGVHGGRLFVYNVIKIVTIPSVDRRPAFVGFRNMWGKPV